MQFFTGGKMRRVFIVMITVIIVFITVSPLGAYADEYYDAGAEITQDIDDALADFDLGIGYDDISDLSLNDITQLLRDKILSRTAGPLRMLTAVMLTVILTAVINSSAGSVLSGTSGELYNMVSVIAAVTVMAPQLLEVCESTLTDIEICGDFILVFVPVFSGVALLSGSLTSAGVYHALILGASEMIIKLSESYLLPVIGISAALAISGSVFPHSSVDSISALLKKTVTWTVSIVMSLFTGFVTLKCSITGKADGAAAKTAKMLISGTIPIVGGAVSDAYSTVKGSFEVIGGTVGAAGIVAIILMVLPKVIELFMYRAVMWAGAAVADVFSLTSVSKLLRSFDSGLSIAQCVLVSYSLMFMISSAILAQTFS